MDPANPIVSAEFTLLRRQMPGAALRGARRYRCDLATLCRLAAIPTGAEHGATAWVHNISKAGIGLICSREFALATNLTLRLRKNDGSGVITIAAQVVHVTREVGGTWRIGCRFERQLSHDEVDDCL